jgi:putative SOS response-associated peptidase YedK
VIMTGCAQALGHCIVRRPCHTKPMCGRYAVTLPPDAMATLFGSADRPNLAPRFNVAPTQAAPMVAIGKAGDRRIVLARWGLRPAWMAKDPPTGPLFNARGETVADKPAFRAAFARKRCLVPADGFYEWKREGKTRTPHFIARTDRAPLAFAGLWESCPDGQGGTLVSMSIVTCAAADSFRPLHDRFPVIAERDAWDAWLNPATPQADLLAMLTPPAEGSMTAWPVSDRVNKVAHDEPGLLDPLPPRQVADTALL